MLLGAFNAGVQAADSNLIINGGFETGNFTGWTTNPSPPNQTYYGVSNRSGSTFVIVPPGSQVSPGATLVHTGNFAAFFGGTGPQLDAISQTFPTISRPLLKGLYKISFQLASNPNAVGTKPSMFQAVWNGRTIFGTANTPSGGYQQFTFSARATKSSSTLAFQGFSFPDFYNLDDVAVTLVKLEQGSFAQYARSASLTPNQRSVATAFDSAVSNRKSDSLVKYLDYRELNQLPADFDRIAPEELTSIYAISTALATVQNTNLQRRTDDLRNGASGFSAAGLAMNGSGPGFSGTMDFQTGAAGPTGRNGKDSKEVKEVAPAADKRWGAFLTGVGEWVDVNSDGNARGYNISTGGFTLGLDYKVCPNFALGVLAGYAGTGTDLTNGGSVLVNGGKLGIYATTFIGGWYADVAVTGGLNGYDTRRSALQGTARGSTNGGELNVLAGTGYDWKLGTLQFGPTATFNYTLVGIDGYTEHGSLVPLNIASRNAESIRSAFGLKASYDWKLGGIVIKPELRAAWQHEYGESSYGLDASFANGAGDSFLVNGPQIGRDSVLLGSGFAIQCSERCATYLYYDGEFGRKDFDRHAVSGGVRLAF